MTIKAEKQHFNRIEKDAKRIQTIFYKVVSDVSNLTQGLVPPFKWKQNPLLEKQVNDIISEFRVSFEIEMEASIQEEWMRAVKNNEAYVSRLAKKTKIAPEKLAVYKAKNLDALNAFRNRVDQRGLTLSKRIWGLGANLKGEFEMAIDMGLADGRSASELSRDIRNFLNRPEDLYRRVRQEGKLIQSQSSIKRIKAEGINYGKGMYQSSYKNAMRVARTEINNAYRYSDYEKRQQLDFVVGIEVKRSNAVYDCDVCESLKGRYPKDFVFTSWHPHCRCYSVSILASESDFIEQQRNLLEGRETELNSDRTVGDVPSNYKDWIDTNRERIDRSSRKGTQPFWMSDNEKYL